MQSVVITGASTGIGWATAKLLLDRGFRVFGSVRKPADADRLRGEFGANFTPLLFDVTDEAAVLAAGREVRAALNGETLTGLVNNAGIAVAGPVLELLFYAVAGMAWVLPVGYLIKWMNAPGRSDVQAFGNPADRLLTPKGRGTISPCPAHEGRRSPTSPLANSWRQPLCLVRSPGSGR